MSRKGFALVLCLVAAVITFLPHAATAQREGRGGGGREGRGGGGNNVGNIFGGIVGGLEQLGRMNQGGNGGNRSNGNYSNNNYYYNDDDDGYYQPNNYYTAPAPNPVPAAKPAPAKPKPNALPKPLKPVKNVVKRLNVNSVTRGDIQDWHDQAIKKINDDINNLKSNLPSDATQAIMLNNTGLSPADIAKAKTLIANGDYNGLKQLFQANNVPAANADPLLNIATANSAINQLQSDAQQGAVTNADVAAVFNALSPFVGPAGASQADAALSDIVVSSQLVSVLNLAIPGNNPLPGIASLIFLVPGLAQGVVFPLGNGAVLAGGNLPDDVGISVCQGPVVQATGLSVGAGQPLPPGGGAGVTSGVLLTNGASLDVNYTVNDQHYTLQPGYKQALPDGATWTVAFDKGGSAGVARYTLSSGTYSFAANEAGWDLYKKTYKVTLDNGKNSQDFNYMIGAKQQTLAAGQAQDLSSLYPIAVTFDNGTGQTVVRRLETGTVSVALTPDGNSIDLFADTDDGRSGSAGDAGNGVQITDALPSRLNLFGKAAASNSRGVQLFGNRKAALIAPAGGAGAN